MQTDSTPRQDNRQTADSSNGDHRGRSAVGPAQVAAAEKETRRLARGHYENFLVATILLPRRLKQPFYNVYAFCRTADDLADQSPSPEIARQRLADFQRRLDETFAGLGKRSETTAAVEPKSKRNVEKDSDHIFIALAKTIEQFDLTQQPFDDLLDAFRQDQEKVRYADFGQLLDYCRRSANPVGRIVLQLGGCLDEPNGELADQICTGLQLANFWQDVARDYAIGRIYLPQDEMADHGVLESMLGQTDTPSSLRKLIASQCDRAEGYLRRGAELAGRVPSWLSSDVKLFAAGGLATLDAIRGIDCDVLRVRPTVSRRRQFWMLAKAAVGRL